MRDRKGLVGNCVGGYKIAKTSRFLMIVAAVRVDCGPSILSLGDPRSVPPQDIDEDWESATGDADANVDGKRRKKRRLKKKNKGFCTFNVFTLFSGSLKGKINKG